MKNGVFVTLTYDEEHLPFEGVDKTHLQKFMKRLRKGLGEPIKYLACGEYGSRTLRAHYHLIILGIGMEKEANIKQAWNDGMIKVGTVTDKSIRYVTNYILKKSDYPKGLNKPFQLTSKGIGKHYAIKNEEQYKQIIKRDRSELVPRYYKKVLNISSEELFEKSKGIHERLIEKIRKIYPSMTDEELHKEVLKARIQRERNLKAQENLREKI